MAKALKTVGVIVAVVALAATGVGVALGGPTGAGALFGVGAPTFMTIGGIASCPSSARNVAVLA